MDFAVFTDSRLALLASDMMEVMMADKRSKPTSRVAKFDTAKFLLIILVVLGHFLETKAFGVADQKWAGALFVFIYSFHMPLFIFISGLFLRRMDATAPFPAFRVASLVMLGLALKIVRSLASFIPNGRTSFALLRDSSTPWFLFALAAFFALAWLVRDIHRAGVLACAIGVGLFAGYDPSVNDTLYLSRIAVFFPFFWLGYCLQPQKILEYARKKWVKILAAAVVLCAASACWFFYTDLQALKYLFAGRLPFAQIAQLGIPECSWLHRALAYVIQLAMSMAVLVLVPERKMGIFTRYGSRSLQVYFWHFLVIMLLSKAGFFPWLASWCPLWEVCVPVIAVAASIVLGVRIWGWPLQWLIRREPSPNREHM